MVTVPIVVAGFVAGVCCPRPLKLTTDCDAATVMPVDVEATLFCTICGATVSDVALAQLPSGVVLAVRLTTQFLPLLLSAQSFSSELVS